MPKSSSASCTPSFLSDCNTRAVDAESCIRKVSVISSSRCCAVETSLRQASAHALDKILVAQLRRRDIHRNAHRWKARVLPRAILPAGCAQYPATHCEDEPAFLRDRDELLRNEQTSMRMAPANEGFDARGRAAPQIHDRLVVQRKFVALERESQSVFDGLTFERADIHVFAEELEIVSTAFLCVVHRKISVLQQRLGVFSILREYGDADAGGNVQAVAVDEERLALKRLENLLGADRGILARPPAPTTESRTHRRPGG